MNENIENTPEIPEIIKIKCEGIEALFQKYITKLADPLNDERNKNNFSIMDISALANIKIDCIYKQENNEEIYNLILHINPTIYKKLNNDTEKKKRIIDIIEFILNRIKQAFNIEKINFQIEQQISYEQILEPKNTLIINGIKGTPQYTFDNFIVDTSNELAYHYIKNIAENKLRDGLTVLLYGPTGLGKSHLLHAMINEMKQHYEGVVNFYTGEIFFSEVMDAFRKKETYIFREQQIEADMLIIDDLHFALKKANEGFISFYNNILNERINRQKWTLLTTDRHPEDYIFDIVNDTVKEYYETLIQNNTDIQTLNLYIPVRDGTTIKYKLHASFVSRLLSGMVLEIVKPTFMAKKRFFWSRLSSKYLNKDYRLTEEENRLIDIFISEVSSDFRYLNGIVNKVGFRILNEKISLKEALIQSIKDYSNFEIDDIIVNRHVEEKSLKLIIEKLLNGLPYTYERLFSTKRINPELKKIRDLIFYILMEKYFYKQKQLAQVFNTDITTIWRARKNIEKIIEKQQDEETIKLYNKLINNVYN
ncbi:hypothetical protein DEFDS_P211 (plasmid) [Deferribacter desulfuricans SSM1]|uniref:Chromosomal replication initiator protein DnaA n=1 Tax=Deferribacter desulfuricans (strain DSM 14783 / JCM 11476 / NBRC 101012 / SSM1) TaxID=639282 RepID=D3PF39_DEFDS|nr:DnaA/Hda family protein [Deferribacter desulfuricans]BAI81831.1 hypothetical protein DEFDS_P211 [Deferribacter desulfuricans SSM1]